MEVETMTYQEKRQYDEEYRLFMAESTYLEMKCFLGDLPLTPKLRLQIIDRMEELECDVLLEQFLIDLRDNKKYHLV